MIATTCPSGEELRALSTGRLADPRGDELLAHIRACETCRSELDTIADGEDSLIASLRSLQEAAPFDEEPGCQAAVSKALGALALASEGARGGELEFLPRVIGEYEIVRPLGRGGMGSVYLARHTKLGREVALKVLAGQRLAEPRMHERFEAEMRAVGKLSHPNIVTAHDAREVEGTAVLVTEYIDGLDLGQIVDRIGPLGIGDACDIGRRVAVALAYTTGQGFVHRDVKPSNIMLSRNGEVKLLDLGLARLQVDDLERGVTGTGQTMGTADYIAPEQVSDSRSVDVRADIYSLGCTLFKLLSGRAPFADAEHATAFAKLTAHVSEDPPSLAERAAGTPAPLVKLVDSMLAKDPAQRPQTPEAVAERLAAFSQNSDLEEVVRRAETVVSAASPSVANSRTPASDLGRTLPLRRRKVPLPVAIGGGVLGVLVGLCLGILIRIEYPDGTVLQVPLPPGSKMTLDDASSKGAPEAGGQADVPGGDATPASKEFAPLQFAVLAEEDLLSAEQIETSKEKLAGSADGPVTTDAGTWYPVATNVQVPIEAVHQGQRYALARRDPQGLVRWGDITGKLGAIAPGGAEGTIEFQSRYLPEKMREVSKNNLGRQLALILNNEIVAAPRIASELESRARFDGLSSEQIRYVMDALNGLINEADDWVHSAKQEKARKNLRAIAVAFQQFCDTHGSFPGSSNRTGAPLPYDRDRIEPFSWRVAILPFVGETELYEQYRFNEPWDSEHNRKLLRKLPAVYRSPYEGDALGIGETHYQGFVGVVDVRQAAAAGAGPPPQVPPVTVVQTALGADGGVSLPQITDGTSPTLLIAETSSSVPWTKPQDISFESLEDVRKVQPFENAPLNFVTADGAVHSMDPIDWERLAKLITRNGGEPVRP